MKERQKKQKKNEADNNYWAVKLFTQTLCVFIKTDRKRNVRKDKNLREKTKPCAATDNNEMKKTEMLQLCRENTTYNHMFPIPL